MRAGTPKGAASAKSTRIFGKRIPVDPKILVSGLIGLAAILFFFNSRSDEASTAFAASRPAPAAVPIVQARYRTIPKIRRTSSKDRETLRVERIDPSKGDIDPTLRLNLLARLQQSSPVSGGRNLFEFEAAPVSKADQAILDNPPVVPKVEPVSLAPPLPAAPELPPIAVKYYGFVKSKDGVQTQKGLFLDGDHLMIGSEGEMLAHRYRVVQLTSTTARLEDVDVKNGETLTVVPAVGSEKTPK
jgi:hypothetical protein